MGFFVDISNYKRLDCTGFFEVNVPCVKVRKLHIKTFRNSKVRRMVYFKEKGSSVAGMCINMIIGVTGKESRYFNKRQPAMAWLKEGLGVRSD